MVWVFLHTHRQWVWSYFESMMLMPKPSPELAAVAGQSIAAITTIAIYGISAITAVVMFFITGNVAALTQMFKFSTAAQVAGSVTSAVESRTEDQTVDETLREFSTPELTERYGDQ
jgi:hypothetical protein